jgi:hypothetical protein
VSFAQLVLPGGNLSGARHGEFRDMSAAEMTAWVDLFGAPAPAIRAHWRAQPAAVERPLRLATFAVGALPFRLEEPDGGGPGLVTRVYEQHTAYRHHCRPSPEEIAATVDYVCVLSSPGEDATPPAGWATIFEAARPLSGVSRRYRVFFNPSPRPPILPPHIDAPCLAAQP